MLDLIADILTTIAAVLFPVFASYKALRNPSPATLSPWLMYWVVFSLLNIAESHFHFILSYVPFYAWMRLGLHLYLVLPGKQGASHIFTAYVDPYLTHHEDGIETFITEAHERAKQAGIGYLKQAISWCKVYIFGQTPAPPSPPPSSTQSYAQQLLARFNLPTATPGGAGPGPDVYGLFSGALAGVMGTSASREQRAEDLSASGTLMPPELHGRSGEEKMRYLSLTRESLRVLLQAFDKEAYTLASAESLAPAASGRSELSKSSSELEFDKIDADEAESAPGFMTAAGKVPIPIVHRTASGGWMPWNWGSGVQPGAEGEKKTQ